MNKRFLIGLLATLVFTVGAIQFIRVNNDHVECEQKVERTKDVAGNTVVATEHVCKEKYNF